MRLALLFLGLLAMSACAQPTQTADNASNGTSDLTRFVQPTNGAAFSQGDYRYYLPSQPPGIGQRM